MGRFLRAVVMALVVVFGSASQTGCATEREPINRIQAGAFAKSFFVGGLLQDKGDDPEFYMRTSVIDVAAGAGGEGLFTNSDSMPTVRVKWEITEQRLIARLTYELIKDTDRKGARRTNDGQVVAAFDILKHFDARREYNVTTGDESNLFVENDVDRPWYQREFMRVDWSKNVVTDAYDLDTLSQLGVYAGVAFEPLSHYANNPESEDAAVYDEKRGYLDITHKVLASPRIIQDEYGDFPACWLVGSWPRESCNPSELVLRSAFLRVEDHDYEPLDFDGLRMELFGYFTSDRLGYDRRYGVVDEKWHRFAARWNVFHASHASPLTRCNTAETTPAGADPHRDENGDGTEDECAKIGRGSRCDAFRGECTLPMRDRKVKTIPWHVNADFPEELFAGTADVVRSWSDSIRVAILAGRLAECRRAKEDGCESQMGWPARWADDYVPPAGNSSPAEVPNVFVLCHNPVDPTKGDDATCGDKGAVARQGDLRFNMVTHVASPQVESPWGIMMDAEDPLTGEKIAGSVSQWGATLDRAAGSLVDILGLINGDVAATDFIKGKNVDDWVGGLRTGTGQHAAAAMSGAEVAARKNAFDPKVLTSRVGNTKKRLAGPPAVRRQARYRELLDAGKLGPGNQELSSRLARLRGSPIETKLVSPELVQAAGFDPTGPLSKSVVERASPFARMSPAWKKSHERSRRAGLAARHSCHLAAAEPDNLLGLAKAAQKLFPPAPKGDAAAAADRQQKIYTWARQEFSKGVYAHEFGHSMGLRHNFAASFDALNYQAPYWQLRTKNGSLTADCPDDNTNGDACVGPRWRDPISQTEIDNNIQRYSTSSVMDYPGDANHDQLLPGKYDRAAVRFGYGGVVDVWNKDSVRVKGSGAGQVEAYRLLGFTQPPGLWGIIDFPPVDPAEPYEHIHYSQYQKTFGLLGECKSDGGEGSVLGQKCAERPMDVVDYLSMQDFAADPAYASYPSLSYRRAVDEQGRVRRGYMFSSDEFSDSGNVPSFTYDSGADAYEQIRFFEAAYEQRYVLDAFRRNRTGFNSYDYISRIQSHYLDGIQQISKAWAFGAVLEGDPAAPADALLADGHYGPLALGATVAMDLFARILTRPEPGSYCGSDEDTCPFYAPEGVDLVMHNADPVPTAAGSYRFTIPLGVGRYVHNDFDYGKGYWWSDYQSQAGAYYEKIWAIYYLAEAFDSFVSNSKEDFTDGRYKNVSFGTVYPAQVRRLFANLLTGDQEAYAPWATKAAGNGPVTVQYPSWTDAAGPAARPAGAMAIDPNFGWNEQLFAMVWGTMFFPTDWSMKFINDSRITALAGEQIGWPPAETYAFYDPATGITYRAHAQGTEVHFGKTHQRGIGARVLEWANTLTALAYEVQRDAKDVPLVNVDGSLKLVLDAGGKPKLATDGAAAEGALRKYVSNIDTLRQLTTTFQQGLDEGSLPSQ